MLPNDVYDLSQSSVYGIFTPGASTHFNYMFENAPLASEIYLQTTDGQFIVQIPESIAYQLYDCNAAVEHTFGEFMSQMTHWIDFIR